VFSLNYALKALDFRFLRQPSRPNALSPRPRLIGAAVMILQISH
jgi:hypothetical protein